MFKITHVQNTQFFIEFKKFNTFKEHYYSKNLHNFVHSKYAMFLRMLKILNIRLTQYFKEC